jgi:hypothetical protein
MFGGLNTTLHGGGATPVGGLDFNQLLRESRHLESAMEGVNTAYHARASTGAGGTGGVAAGAGSLGLAVRVPTLQRNLQQLGVASRRLARQQVPSDAATDSQAQLLLSAKGIDLRKQSRALKDMELALPQARHAQQPTAGIESVHPLDIERFLAQQQQLLCHQAMEEAAKVTSDTYRRHDLASLADDWEVAKREILDSLGFRGGRNALGGADADASALTGQNGKRKSPTALHAGPTGPVLAMEQAIYARTVQDLNRARVRRGAQPFDLLTELQSASAQVDEFFAAQGAPQGLAQGDVADCWEVLRCMLDGGNQAGQTTEVITEKLFAAAYSSPSNSPESRALQAQLVEGARQYSQQLFEQYLRSVVAKYSDARGRMTHGKPTFAQQVASYVTILSGQLPTVSRECQLDGAAFWPQVYFAFRCGRVDTAVDLLRRQLGGGAGSAQNTTSAFGTGSRAMSMGMGLGGPAGAQAHSEPNRMLVEALERRATSARPAAELTGAMWMALQEEYQRELAQAVNAARAHGGGSAQAANYADPYKLALYHLLGRFRLPAFDISAAMVQQTIEDHLWWKLTLLEGAEGLRVPEAMREQVDVNAMRLDALQADLLQRGEAAFNPDGRHPLSYFKVLLLSQQFEQAVYYLIRTPFFSIGVHFAIALDYVGVLHTHTNAKEELLISVSGANSSSSGSSSSGAASSSASSRFAVHYSRILRKYVESFVRTHAFEAFHYLYLLHPQGVGGVMRRRGAGAGVGGNQTSFAVVDHMDDTLPGNGSDGSSFASDASFPAMRDLILETRDYPLLVGAIVATGAGGAGQTGGSVEIQTGRGLVYAYYERKEARHLIMHTASTMEAHGLTIDAIQLFLLAYRFDLAVELLLKTLSPLVAAGMQQSERSRLVELAQQVQRIVRNQPTGGLDASRAAFGREDGEVSDLTMHALHQLLLLVNYFDLYHLGPQQYEAALVVLSQEDLDLVPFHTEEVVDKAAKFVHPGATHLALGRCISDVAVSLMDIYYVQFQMVKREMQSQHVYGVAHAQRDQTKQQRILALRSQASALLSFLGRIQSLMQVTPETIAQLQSAESLMTV